MRFAAGDKPPPYREMGKEHYLNVILSSRDVSGRTEKEREESATKSHSRYFFDGKFLIFPLGFVVAAERQRSFGCLFVRPLKCSDSG